MYIVTFYSFRGGVGRSTTLVNVGMELARRGRKVLLVDFDLESPDLTNFPPLKRAAEQPGIVEFVTDYREKGRAPDVTEYLCSLGPVAGTKGGRVWVMPAGKSNYGEYWKELAEIDWPTLYDREQGYLFFEDMREQWRKLGVDYVLIDTHAGVTPSLGIITRQLADVVVMMFTPRQGTDLLMASSWINEEEKRRKPIQQFFVPVKVEDTDDELGADPVSSDCDVEIVGGIEGYDTVVIPFSHRLLLGKQVVDQEQQSENPEHRWLSRDRLAREYRKLANAIIMANFAGDPDGARVILYNIHKNLFKAIETPG